MEETLKSAQKILVTIGWIFLIGGALFALEVGFIMGILSLSLWIVELGGDPAPVFLFLKIHNFALQFAFIMFIFSSIVWVIREAIKGRMRREILRWQARREAIEEIKQAVMSELKPSRRKRK